MTEPDLTLSEAEGYHVLLDFPMHLFLAVHTDDEETDAPKLRHLRLVKGVA